MAWLNQKKKKKYVLLHGFGSSFSAKFNPKSHFNMIFKFNIIVMNINKWMCFLEMVFFDKLLWSRFLQKPVVFLCLHVLNVNVTIWKSISFLFCFVLFRHQTNQWYKILHFSDNSMTHQRKLFSFMIWQPKTLAAWFNSKI